MLNYIISALIAIVTSIGIVNLNAPTIWDNAIQFGTISYPTSLDTLVNPSGTDSVATVSHSSQHSNANDAIEAIEAKVGTGASTAVANTILVGDGTGTSKWSLFATSTQFSATNFLGTGSTTINSFYANLATTSQATTTNLFATTASTTNFYGANLSTCNGATDAVTWVGGKFGCNTIPAGGNTLTRQFASSTGTYLMHIYSLENNDSIMWWATCDRASANSGVSLNIAYRTSNDDVAATTTIINMTASGNTTGRSGFGMFTATTTYDVYVEATGAACDRFELMSQKIH